MEAWWAARRVETQGSKKHHHSTNRRKELDKNRREVKLNNKSIENEVQRRKLPVMKTNPNLHYLVQMSDLLIARKDKSTLMKQ